MLLKQPGQIKKYFGIQKYPDTCEKDLDVSACLRLTHFRNSGFFFTFSSSDIIEVTR